MRAKRAVEPAAGANKIFRKWTNFWPESVMFAAREHEKYPI